jgi:hypothetical protein
VRHAGQVAFGVAGADAVQRFAGHHVKFHGCVFIDDGLRIASCEMLLAGVFDLQQQVPDSRDMDDLSFAAVRDVYQFFVAFFTSLLNDSGIKLKAPSEDVARALIYGARGLRDVAGNTEEYRAMIRQHVAFLCHGAIRD